MNPEKKQWINPKAIEIEVNTGKYDNIVEVASYGPAS
ncbi:hypothetical protein IWX80_001155 [Flavobacterium sp. CAN_S2]